mmetsp:Transcript_2611/g.3636  ORF Transcript_2611/g.3636 Transcript_2611/m.3636 type:complete len:97 (-) Transcript_2611:245-535(-)
MFAVGCIVYILLTGSHPFDPNGNATDDTMIEFIESLTPDLSGEQLLDTAVFDECVSELSPGNRNNLRIIRYTIQFKFPFKSNKICTFLKRLSCLVR